MGITLQQLTDSTRKLKNYIDNKSLNISAKEGNAAIIEEDGLYVATNTLELEQVNQDGVIEDTPVGHIISHMGTVAPVHYLICDGTEYNITDYPHLTKHFIDQLGSVNYFGGDGETTFAVPDLRGEFLRGTGTALRNTGSGADVGAHQDATVDVFNYISANGSFALRYSGSKNFQTSNVDTWVGSYTDMKGNQISPTLSPGTTSMVSGEFTSRPTNTSVLYCIKYEPTYCVQNTNYNTNYLQNSRYSLDEKIIGEWVNGKPLYQKTFIFSEGYYENTVLQTGITDMEMCLIKDGRYRMVNNTIPLNYSHPTVDSLITTYVRCTTGEICLRPGSGYTDSNKIDELQITLLYTKTTDEENSFTKDMIAYLATSYQEDVLWEGSSIIDCSSDTSGFVAVDEIINLSDSIFNYDKIEIMYSGFNQDTSVKQFFDIYTVFLSDINITSTEAMLNIVLNIGQGTTFAVLSKFTDECTLVIYRKSVIGISKINTVKALNIYRIVGIKNSYYTKSE